MRKTDDSDATKTISSDLRQRAEDALSEYLRQVGVVISSCEILGDVETAAGFLAHCAPKYRCMAMLADRTIIDIKPELIGAEGRGRKYMYFVLGRIVNENGKEVLAVFDFRPSRRYYYGSPKNPRLFKVTVCPVSKETVDRSRQLLLLRLMEK
jgi:hypothetical protein